MCLPQVRLVQFKKKNVDKLEQMSHVWISVRTNNERFLRILLMYTY
jgi:hypothetical protein